MIRAVLPDMLRRKSGAVVNVGSLNARLPDPLVLDYSAAKAALGNATKSLSKANAGQGIRINSVEPGPVATDLWIGDYGVAVTVGRASGSSPEKITAGAAAAMPRRARHNLAATRSPASVLGVSAELDGPDLRCLTFRAQLLPIPAFASSSCSRS
jgi:short-subunit dehydrogenase